MGTRARAAFALVTAASAGCSLWLGLEPPGYDPVPGPTGDLDAADLEQDSAVRDEDGSTDGADASNGVPAFDDPARWTTYDGLGNDWYAGTFDGRFVYFLRAGVSRIARFDTQQENAFGLASSWSLFDPATVAPTMGTTYAITFDGRFVVLGNYAHPEAGIDGTFVRYDTTTAAPFESPLSWETFDTSAVTLPAGRFVSAATYRDASYFGANAANRPFLRRTPSGAFDSGWEPFTPTFDASVCNRSNFGAACAGDFVYFAPGNASAQGDCVVRYDARRSFGELSSWECYSLGAISPDLTGMQGAASDGKYVYLTEVAKGLGDAADLPRRIARHGAGSALDAGWEVRLTTVTNPLISRYFGGTFDGRFVYFAPFPDNGSTVYLRYDTTRPFADDGAWTAVPSQQVLVLDASHAGALFDGKYVYYAPRTGRAVRYRARDDHAYVASCSGF